ncbi:MAG: aspartyl/asparaginyl beta-hydroxylase domain-containing protein [Planctomycetaceae bacterium]|nr:aspartyl/asparaginyl beta-hydroxylase domain-containing protein [Planctomycetaceae bacterium]
MIVEELVASAISTEELAMCRVGVLPPRHVPDRLVAAETILLDASEAEGVGPACEVILTDVRDASISLLRAAVRRLSRDGLLFAAVREQFAEQAVRTVANAGTDWVAVVRLGDEDCCVVAALDTHPAELGVSVANFVVNAPSTSCIHLPQNRDDRAKRRYVRRKGRDRLLALACRLQESLGSAVERVVAGVEVLVGEKPARVNNTGARPGMFGLPGLKPAAWPDPVRWPRLKALLEACDRHAPAVCPELRELISSRSLEAYLPDEYNKNKFQMRDAANWKALRLYADRGPTPDLLPTCRATRDMLTEIGRRISGEATILRIAPRSKLPAHVDDYDYEVYVHIGLTVPPGCQLRVGGEARPWEEGRSMAFMPAFLHEAWNESDRPRDVLALDTWHPDLSDAEIEALIQVRTELDALRRERRKNEGHK